MRPGSSRLSALALAALASSLWAVALVSCGGEEDAAPTTTGTTGTNTATETGTETQTQTQTETETAPVEERTVVRVTVSGGVSKSGIVRAKASRGDQVVLVVQSDVADEIHLHGYDLTRDVAAGGTARIRFTASIPGRFEVELETRGVQIAELTVEP